MSAHYPATVDCDSGGSRLVIVTFDVCGDLSLTVANNLFLGFWTANSIPGFRQADYTAVYASLGESPSYPFLVLSAS